jgi:thioredoxin reductase (NADPH)
METNVPGVFIAGVLSAGFDANKVFIENGRGHGEKIVGHVARRAT